MLFFNDSHIPNSTIGVHSFIVRFAGSPFDLQSWLPICCGQVEKSSDLMLFVDSSTVVRGGISKDQIQHQAVVDFLISLVITLAYKV